MFYGRASAFRILAVVTVLTLRAVGQSVISTRSGIVHFFEGAVYLGDQPLESHPGRFSIVPQGTELRTAEGRAEVLLTPGVFLRVGENSAIRMLASELSHTSVELLAGSAVVDSAEPSSGTSVTLIYRNWTIRFLEQGVYRVDSDPPRLWVLKGKAEVSADTLEGALSVGQGMNVAFASVLVPERSTGQPDDALSAWVERRQQSISADNAIAANIRDPASISASNSGQDPVSTNTSNSGHSFTLPGYIYLPLVLGLAAGWTFSWASSSTAPRRSFSLSLSTPCCSGRLLPTLRFSSPGAGFVQPARLFRPLSARVQLHLAIPVRPVSRVGIHVAAQR